MILRVNKNTNYTVMSNQHLREPNMSLKAKGLLSLILSLPDNWDYSVSGLEALSKDGRDGVAAGLKELEKFGYLVRTRKMDELGHFAGFNYDIYEEPQNINNNADNDNESNQPLTENPFTDKPFTENPQQINKDNKVNKEYNNKINKDKAQNVNDVTTIKSNNNPLTEELIKRHFISNTDLDINNYNKLFDSVLTDLKAMGLDYSYACKIVNYVVSKMNAKIDEISNKYSYLKTSICLYLIELKNNNDLDKTLII